MKWTDYLLGETGAMVYIGCHLTVTNGYEAMGHQMVDFGGNTFSWFTRNPRGGKSKEKATNLKLLP